ncbi:MAG: GntR family transcriptional regulator [Anaerolineaceae bacterium]|nr:GntR family transcriptional regulator [Anaerolineaceae bacterium]
MNDQIQRSQPVAEQVLSILRQRIHQRVYGPDNRLPAESELAAELRVSRATIRSALSALAAERIIVRRQGDGTYINRRFLETTTHFGSITEYTSMIRSSGHEPHIKALERFSRPATQAETEDLEIPAGTQVVVLVRLFLSDNQPAIYSIDSVPEALMCCPLTSAEIEEPLPIFFKRVCGQEFTFGISTVSAQSAPADVSEKFDLAPGAPVLRMHEVFFNDNDQPLVYAMNYFNEAVFQLRVARAFD